jgi:hypothetical protein
MMGAEVIDFATRRRLHSGPRVLIRNAFGRPVIVRLDSIQATLRYLGHLSPAELVEHLVRRLQDRAEQRREALADLARGTIAKGPHAGRPYAAGTIASRRTAVRWAEECFAHEAEALCQIQPGEESERIIAAAERGELGAREPGESHEERMREAEARLRDEERSLQEVEADLARGVVKKGPRKGEPLAKATRYQKELEVDRRRRAVARLREMLAEAPGPESIG